MMKNKKYASIKEVRTDIDLVDTQIVDLLSKRSKMVAQLARFKPSVEAVKDAKRIEEVLDGVRTQAIENGISPKMVEEVFKTLIDQMVYFEIEEFENKGAF